MINISLDNPYLLLLLIPLVLAVVIPFAIAIRKENNSKGTVTALICHLLIVVLVVFAVAGLKNTNVITATEVYALVDVSYSTNEKLDTVDNYIKELEKELPKNSKLGVVTFGKDAKLHTEPGDKFTTVKNSGTDAGATDIVAALKYTDGLFSENTIKHVVLYTDGMSTNPEANEELIRVIEDMKERGIYINIVYIDSNISENVREFQVSDVEFNASTYLGHDVSANILIESTVDADVIVKLSKKNAATGEEELYREKAVSLNKGYNIVNFGLYTESEGEYDYEISLHTQGDTSDFNNTFDFTQKVNKTISVLLVTDNKEDVETVKALYGGGAEIDARVKPAPDPFYSSTGKPKPFDVPYTVEDLCKYDEIILSNVKVNEINNADNFVKSLDICVSTFGKSLITAGDNNLQNNDATSVESLKNMLPVRFGNSDEDPKLYVVVIDSSRSMEFNNFDWFKMAKSAGKYLLDFLGENDYFALFHFSGNTYVSYLPTKATPQNIAEAKATIDGLQVTQGTMIGSALNNVCDTLTPYFSQYNNVQLMLISDGMAWEGFEDDPYGAAERLRENDVAVSALNSGNINGEGTMMQIAASGGGKYYFAKSSDDLVGVMFDEIADDVTETVIEKPTSVEIRRESDDVFSGIVSLPQINGYVYSKPKASAQTVLIAMHEKPSGKAVEVPIYAYWEYGSGRVATLTTNLGGEWTKNWQDGEGLTFLENIRTTNVPKEKIDYPYTVDVSFDGKYTHVEITPAQLNPDATMTVTVKLPNGEEITKLLTFDSYRYFYQFETNMTGKYTINTTYDWSTKSYSSSSVFNISYSPEYDSFNTYSPAVLHTVVRDNGKVTENGNATLEVDPTRLETYVTSFTVPFLILAAAIYLIDTVIRKLKWADLKSFFKKKKKGAIK